MSAFLKRAGVGQYNGILPHRNLAHMVGFSKWSTTPSQKHVGLSSEHTEKNPSDIAEKHVYSDDYDYYYGGLNVDDYYDDDRGWILSEEGC